LRRTTVDATHPDTSNILISRAGERYTRTSTRDAPVASAPGSSRRRTSDADAVRRGPHPRAPRGGHGRCARSRCSSARGTTAPTSRSSSRPQHSVRQVGGLKFLEAAHVKDVLAFLRVLENPRDEVSWYRCSCSCRASARSRRATRWKRWPGTRGAMRRSASSSRRRAPAPRHQALVTLLDTLRSGPPDDEGAVAREIARVRVLYDDILREKIRPPRPAPRRPRPAAGDRGRLSEPRRLPQRARARAAAGNAGPRLWLRQRGRTRSCSPPRNSAKGPMGRRLRHLGGWMATSRSHAPWREDQVDEERRLMYVALTRARNHLAVSYPLNVYDTRRGADYTFDQVSRFLDRRRARHDAALVAEPPAAELPAPDEQSAAGRSQSDDERAVRA